MKTTMIFAESGDTYLSVNYKPGEVTHRNIKLQNTLYYAEITGSEESGFAVRFHLPYFRMYDKGGFISKQSALNYEQDILDAHFDDFIAGEPEELFETGIA
ncbi:MAG: hypothetical protein IK990_01190 [Ruminiclostridium sp.]|nr:hypothetical protein [Ruminiclostridium sp.]